MLVAYELLVLEVLEMTFLLIGVHVLEFPYQRAELLFVQADLHLIGVGYHEPKSVLQLMQQWLQLNLPGAFPEAVEAVQRQLREHLSEAQQIGVPALLEHSLEPSQNLVQDHFEFRTV